MNRFSIIIPAYNEERLIAARLEHLLIPLNNFCDEIIIVCNGCTDKTASKARFALNRLLEINNFDCHVIIEELKLGSKTKALNHGIKVSKNPVVVLLDADIDITSDGCAKLVNFLSENNLQAASPAPNFNFCDAHWLNKRFYKVVSASSYNKKHRIANVIALSKSAKTELFPLPNVIADDAYIQRVIGESNYRLMSTLSYTFHCPKSVLAMFKVQARIIRGNLELKRKFPTLKPPKNTIPSTNLINKSVFIAIKIIALVIARYELTFNIEKWHKDESSRK